jgi:hypothetical protein
LTRGSTRSIAPLIIGLLALVTACDSTPNPASGTRSSAPARALSAQDEFTAAANKLNATSYRFTFHEGPASGEGSHDPASRSNTHTLLFSCDMPYSKTEVVKIGNDVYVRLSGMVAPAGVDGKTWYHFEDTEKISLYAIGLRNDDADTAGVQTVVESLDTVDRTTDGAFEGNLDFRKSLGRGLPQASLDNMGEELAKHTPFEAKVDQRGYLVSMTIHPGAGGAVYTFSDIGSAGAAGPPAGPISDAPKAIFDLLAA